MPGLKFMANVIPAELKNSRGLQKLRDFYAEQLKELGDENAPLLIQLRSDIQSIERELVGKPLAAATSRK